MSENQTHEGVIMIRGKGTGFLSIPEEKEDVIIPREQLGFALDGDIVEIELLGKTKEGRREGAVLRVISPKR